MSWEQPPPGYHWCAQKDCRNMTRERYCRAHVPQRTEDTQRALFDEPLEEEPREVLAFPALLEGDFDPPAMFMLHGRPVPAARPRVNTQTGQAYTPARYARWKAHAAAELLAQGHAPIEGPVLVGITIAEDMMLVSVMPDAEGRKPLPGDIDNYAKAALDALQQGGIIANDSQVVNLRVRFAEDPEK